MNDDDRKFLTEAMGECWNENSPCKNRTFTTWDDFGAVKEKLWSNDFQKWLEHELTWKEWEQKSPEEMCNYFVKYIDNMA